MHPDVFAADKVLRQSQLVTSSYGLPAPRLHTRQRHESSFDRSPAIHVRRLAFAVRDTNMRGVKTDAGSGQ